jgi:hypothetical protein
VWGKTLEDVLSSLSIEPDMEADGAAPLLFLHRHAVDADWYFVANHSDQSLQTQLTFRVAGRQPELWHPDSGVMEKAPVFSEKDQRITVPLAFDPAGSVFVVFRSPPLGDHIISVVKTGPNGQAGNLTAIPSYELKRSDDGNTTLLLAHQSGRIVFKTSSGKDINITAVDPNLSELTGPWKLDFPAGWGAPASIQLDRLMSWPDYPDKGVKFFSGTATYSKDIDIPAPELGQGKSLLLDLGEVKNLAHVKLNNIDLGILWKPPFRVDLSSAARPGANHLQIAVTNLWPNRIIGDLNLPDDMQWNGDKPASWPQWLLDGKPSPTGRFTFYTWRHWKSGAALLPSGLIGPVKLEAGEWMPVK